MIRISSSQCIYSMSVRNIAAAEAYPGETIIFETKDCFSNEIQTEQDLFANVGWDTINPATGPLKVRGAEPQDILTVKILNIEIADRGTMVAVPNMGALGHHITHSQTKTVPIVSGRAVFGGKINLPISPMIGVIGTSPATEDIPNGTPGAHGGNMDTRLITKGATLYLPVFVEGAGLAVGDLHAVMADGEVVICGVEVSGEVTVQVDLIKEKALPSPVLENEKSFYCIASAESLDSATASVLDHTIQFLKQRLPLPVNEIAMLMSVACNLQISQIVDPLRTVRMEIPKNVFEPHGLRF